MVLLAACLISITAIAQNRTITGKVVAENTNEIIPSATVEVKGFTRSVSGNTDGTFAIAAPKGTVILVVSSIGYNTKEVNVPEGESSIIINLIKSDVDMGGVVVIGYGKQKRGDLTGSISSLKGSDVKDLGTQRVDQALQGKAAGVLVLNTDGAPGGSTTIRVRGMNSVMGGNNALVVIDGLQGGDLTKLNPNDVESIEVLKDASATAIYGAQGANGVILVTTKMGKKGKPVISYDFFYGQQKIIKKLDVMSAAEFARTVNAYRLSQNGSGVIPQAIFTEPQIKEFESRGFGTDWQDVIYRKAPLQNHELSISGGTDNTRYLVSAGYLNQTGIMLNSFYKRFTLRTNIQSEITNWASFSLNWSGSKEQGNAPSYGSSGDVAFNAKPSNAAPRWDAIQPVYDSAGNYQRHPAAYGARDVWNPLASTVEPKIDNGTLSNNLYAALDFKLLPGLSFRISAGGSMGNLNNKAFYNNKTASGLNSNGLAQISESEWRYFQNSNILTYDKIFNRHHITFTGVEEQSFSKNFWKGETAEDFATDLTGFNNLAGAKRIVINNDASERKLQSYLGRINYIFDNRYLLTASLRGDGSSVFGANNKWGYFPSFSVAWKAAEESFIKSLDIFSDLKFRYSWGVTGNQAISPYQSFATLGSGLTILTTEPKLLIWAIMLQALPTPTLNGKAQPKTTTVLTWDCLKTG